MNLGCHKDETGQGRQKGLKIFGKLGDGSKSMFIVFASNFVSILYNHN